MGFQKKKRIRHILAAFLRMITALSLLVGAVPGYAGVTAQAAVAPTLSITMGTPRFYSTSGSNPASVTYKSTTTTTSNMSASMSENVVTIKENSASKLFELGYVPITVSMTMPAKTAYQVTLTFTASGVKSASGGSAVAFLEIYDFGSADYSGSLTFNMSDNATNSHAAYTKLRAREDSRNTNFGGTYSVTVTFENTSALDRTISHYFGFFTGVHYGSKYDHTLTSTCTITAGKITDLDDIVPTISVNSNDSRTIGWDKLLVSAANTFSKDNFVPDKDWNSLTKEEQQKALNIGYAMVGHTPYPQNAWNNTRLTLSLLSNNGLRFSLKEETGSNQGRLAYVPFSVPISVPAKTTRTYDLTFEINYERHTDSGAGFFAELIQGGVPELFNTAASATMTGNTKLRVYSTGGTAHSGSVTIPITLTNDTGSTKSFSESFVFFAGWRPVGAYTPNPVFNINLTDISYASYESDFGVTVNATNCSYTAPAKVGTNENCSVTFTPNTGYSLPSTVAVDIGGSSQLASYYTYNNITGTLTIPAKYITGNVTITAAGVPNKYTITYSGLEGASLTTKPTTHTYGTETKVGNPTKTGYVFNGWKINSGTTAYKDLTLGAKAYTGNITLAATWTKAKYNATLTGSNVTASTGFGTGAATYQTAWTGKFTANIGYLLPSSISVKVGGTTLDSSKYTYTQSTGTVTIGETYVTDSIVITANGHKHSYTGKVTTPATCTTDGVKTFTCSCGDSYTEPIPATGHSWASTWTYDETHHWHICTNGCNTTDTKIAHSLIWVVDKEPAMGTSGERHQECTVCDYAKAAEAIQPNVSVRISWESMDFTYTDGEWHPETHSRDAGSWSATAGGITAQNNGNVDVAANFAYTPAQGMADITGAFTYDSMDLPVGKSGSTKLSLSGKPANALSNTPLGTVTITITAPQNP